MHGALKLFAILALVENLMADAIEFIGRVLADEAGSGFITHEQPFRSALFPPVVSQYPMHMWNG
jgi:hypothetical protein